MVCDNNIRKTTQSTVVQSALARGSERKNNQLSLTPATISNFQSQKLTEAKTGTVCEDSIRLFLLLHG